MFLPENAPVASVSTMPVPGWTATPRRRQLDRPLDVHGVQLTEVVSSITWTASAGAAIRPGQFQEFPVSMGPLPNVDKMVFKALQTYSDGRVVRWIEEPGADDKEPESPAPTLKLLPAAERAVTALPAVPPAGPGSNRLAIGLGVAGHSRRPGTGAASGPPATGTPGGRFHRGIGVSGETQVPSREG